MSASSGALSAPKRWISLATVCIAVLMTGMDNSIVTIALPTLSNEFGGGMSALQWIVDSYTLVFAGLLLATGYFGDRIGRRKVLVAGLVCFIVISVLATRSTSLAQLITARAALGAAAALIFPATLAIISVLFPEKQERTKAIAVWSAAAGASIAIGPVVGGYLVEHFAWSSVFWINVPISVIAIIGCLTLVPESFGSERPSFDLFGVLLSISGITLLVWALIEAPNFGWGSAPVVGALVAAAVFLVTFVVYERRQANPVLDVTLFRSRGFAMGSFAICAGFFCLLGFVFITIMYFQAVLGYGPLETAVRVIPFALVAVAVTPLAALANTERRMRFAISTGLAIMAAGFVFTSRLTESADYLTQILPSMSVIAVGLGLLQGPATTSVMTSVPSGEAGAGSAVNDTTREVGGALGVAILGSVVAHLYSARVAEDVARLPVAPGIRAEAESSVIGGVRAIGAAPPELQAALGHTVQQAFVSAMQSANLVAAGVGAVACVVVAVFLRTRPEARHRRSTSQTQVSVHDLVGRRAGE
ncbi:Drug resistance transporter, EmrB/QacA subfamily OS=Tsukamurella paurometabola (strain ATCC 8368 /DSM / CCUG 35730 / CIP 100753 / JCM 10117 / KCTC 9821/ NBRC 16120 / NCIMB 702349 / NCTC 13040) OX=521096 GN=Tpau_0007 PE=4 SV=1 [Tsukamurella paurometabola]|uniref:Drug resistance transporter, EmrB/QacA subfamily n=1 Tax=Tsukamurella paurometabola (strain ATCC 8368 / DSM 20162 / CCUG 35730 / CIP 100753 / JCM 10117 / KCTC 9821 / NBRC 16120 / NCIMB 702349 / NCTC 13040) TaxID=521096 RepID=D5UPA9_TSUPD|nr:MFS transporter [Tsukamurella paurometabola]ADG76661.1 drug resistance transporter, EmrB/QacA subfamily [Tsukamurella paurometabola DSM 20162]SUP41110.1 Antiseptic resistance protein [Tsukamurella paurometabola]